jgi:hypothetical protein
MLNVREIREQDQTNLHCVQEPGMASWDKPSPYSALDAPMRSGRDRGAADSSTIW